MSATIHYTRPDGGPARACCHTFANETRQNYVPEAAALARRRTVAFLGTHLA